MVGRIVLITLLSLLMVGSIAGKYIRYVELQPPMNVEQQGAANTSALTQLMQASGFRLLYTRKIYNNSNDEMGVYHYGTCKGLLYLAPIKSDETDIIRSFAQDLAVNKVQFIYQGKQYSTYPSMAYFIGNITQKLQRVLHRKSYHAYYPMVVASIEIGSCQLAEKIKW